MTNHIPKNLLDVITNNQIMQKIIPHLPLAIEILATIWVILFFSFEPIIPVYQGY